MINKNENMVGLQMFHKERRNMEFIISTFIRSS